MIKFVKLFKFKKIDPMFKRFLYDQTIKQINFNQQVINNQSKTINKIRT